MKLKQMNLVILKDVRLNDEEMYYINKPCPIKKKQYILVDFNFFYFVTCMIVMTFKSS